MSTVGGLTTDIREFYQNLISMGRTVADALSDTLEIARTVDPATTEQEVRDALAVSAEVA
jgi:hypothetical protein